jgi:hypothetical protein
MEKNTTLSACKAGNVTKRAKMRAMCGSKSQIFALFVFNNAKIKKIK